MTIPSRQKEKKREMIKEGKGVFRFPSCIFR
jgi:hypothetical protein